MGTFVSEGRNEKRYSRTGGQYLGSRAELLSSWYSVLSDTLLYQVDSVSIGETAKGRPVGKV
jgi:hypothetical protein